MPSPLSLNALPVHAPLWTKLQPMIQNGRLAHAFLFSGSRSASMMSFVNRFVAMLLCQHQASPCGLCHVCKLFKQSSHPDVVYVRPETEKGSIKIDQIRTLQEAVYQTPHCGSRRFIILEPADKLNRSAVNALLKILEEPPLHAMFILIAEHKGHLPATIISRCQQHTVPAPASIAPWADESIDRSVLIQQRMTMIESMNALVAGKTTACTLAAQWSNDALDDLISILYGITTEAIEHRLGGDRITSAGNGPLSLFAQTQSVELLFRQLDTMMAFLKKIQQNIPLNQTLALERILLGFSPC